jgi:hypothetical protein
VKKNLLRTTAVAILLVSAFIVGAMVVFSFLDPARAQQPFTPIPTPAATPLYSMELPSEIRNWFRNPDGSCVQCSIGMCGADQNVPEATTLLWDTEYGPRVRGGSAPSRVADYARRRQINLYNITGDSTFEWMKWACRNGKGAAIGAGRMHFQTLYGHDPVLNRWYVCNNNSPQRIDVYSDEAFRQLHLASGRWVVILNAPAHPAPMAYVKWWE